MLAQLDELDRDEALAKGWWNLSMILLILGLAVLFMVAMFLLRRWKRQQLKNIEQDREQRRAAGKTGERLDAWAASAQRYVDHDKLSPDDDLFERDDEDDYPGDDDNPSSPEEEDRDPFGLFSDKPYQESGDDDDDDDDEDEDWDDEDEDEDDKR